MTWGWHNSAFRTEIFSPLKHCDASHGRTTFCLVISDTPRPVVQCKRVHSITPETTTEGCGQVNWLWENSGVCSRRSTEKIYCEKKIYITFNHGERTKRLTILWGGQVYSWFDDITARFESDIIACKSNWVQRNFNFPSYQTSLSDSEGEGKASTENFKKVKKLAHLSKLFRLLYLKLFFILCF